MRRLIFSLVLGSGVLLSGEVGAQTCPSLADIRSSYFERENFEKARRDLECVRQSQPENVSVLRFLSDVLWWNNHGKESRKVAREALDLLPDRTSALALHLYERTSRFRVGAAYEDVFSTNRTSYEVRLNTEATYWNKNRIGFQFVRDSRFFDRASGIADLSYEVSHSANFKRAYLITRGQWSREPSFLPKWSVYLEPHWVWEEIDFSLAADFRRYETEDVYSFRPGVFLPLAERLQLQVFVDWTVRPTGALSATLAPRIEWTARLGTSFRLAGGKVNEGNGLVDDFFSAGLQLNYQLLRFLELQGIASIYRGDLREENRLGVGSQIQF